MPNYFSIRRSDPPAEKISISDRGTDALMNILLLAASEIAETESQKRMTVWLAEHDRKRGRGTMGFCIAEMPWAAESFAADKRFLVAVTDAASQQTGWEKLDYRPNSDALMPMLRWFRKAFFRLQPADVNPHALEGWLADMEPDDPVLNGYPRCPRHGIYLSWCGCQICNS